MGALILAAVILFLILRPVKTFDSPVTEFDIVTQEVKAGERVHWIAQTCRYTNKPFESNRYVLNVETNVKYPLPEVPTTSKVALNKCETNERDALIPLGVPPGKYILFIHTVVRVNKWNLQPVDFRTKSFNVIK